MSYYAKVILDSVSPAGHRLTTLEVQFPRFVLAELNTHRVFSRNSASSRAVPIAKMIDRVKNDPVYPREWGKNKSGMQADETLDEYVERIAMLEWQVARDNAVEQAEQLANLGAHKQIVNRLLEPFLWHTVLVTSTEWDNFFEQRLSPNAQPEMQETARQMKAAIDGSEPHYTEYGRWHAPFMNAVNLPAEIHDLRISVARCARVSYLQHDGTHDEAKDLALFEKLIAGKHLSPFEHVARPSNQEHFDGIYTPQFKSDEANFKGWRQARWNIEHNLTLST